jgi:hypothetical protein
MKKVFLIVFLVASLSSANKVFEIEESEYIKYKEDPEKMMEIFKNKFLNIKKKEIGVKKLESKIEKNIEKKEELKESKKVVRTKNYIPLVKTSEEMKESKKLVALVDKEKDTEKKKNKRESKILLPVIKKEKVDLDIETIDTHKQVFKKKELKLSKKSKKINNKIIDKMKNSSVKEKPKIVVLKPKEDKKVQTKKTNKISFYNFVEVNKKLSYNKIKKEKNIKILSKSINKILKDKKIVFDEKEIEVVLTNIKQNRLSVFESKIYIEQIVSLLKGQI